MGNKWVCFKHIEIGFLLLLRLLFQEPNSDDDDKRSFELDPFVSTTFLSSTSQVVLLPFIACLRSSGLVERVPGQ